MRKLICFFVVAIFSAHAAVTWSPAVDISLPSSSAGLTQVGVDADGTATAVWLRSNGTNTIIQTADRPLQGDWTLPINISTTGLNSTEPQISVNARGDATAVFTSTIGGVGIIQAVDRAAGGIWTAPTSLSAAGASASAPQVIVDAAGNATAIWVRSTIIQAAERPFGGVWTTPVNLSAAGGTVPQIAVDSFGNVTAVWQMAAGIQAAERPFGGVWTAAVTISPAGATTPQIAVDPSGNATSVWRTSGGAIAAADRPFGGAWTAPVTISAVGINPQVGVDAAGNATAVWQNTVIQAAQRPLGGAWTSPVTLSGAANNNPQVAVDPAGNATAVWILNATSATQASSIPFGGSWSTPIDLSALPGSNNAPQIIADPNGNLTVGWGNVDGSSVTIQAAEGILLQPVSALSARKKVNNFGAVSERFNSLKWHASISSDVIGYRIFRDGALIATIQAGGAQRFVFEDHDRPKYENPVYTVVGINSGGEQSPPVTTVAD